MVGKILPQMQILSIHWPSSCHMVVYDLGTPAYMCPVALPWRNSFEKEVRRALLVLANNLKQATSH